MKHCILFLSISLFMFFFAAQYSFAALGTIRSFGGKVTATTTPGVLCAAQYGAMTITPVGGTFPPTPYVIPATKNSITPGAWILGLYNSVLTPGLCYTESVPPVPYPAFTILKFGVSKMPSL